MPDTPPAVAAALAHVASIIPAVASVTFSLNDDGGAVWLYETADGEAPAFPDSVDVGLLEAALDAACEAAPFPVTYKLEGAPHA